MKPNQDQDIIDKVLKGQTNAFSEIVDHYKDMVYSLALKMMKDKNLADEVSQNTFIKIYRKLSSFKGQSKFSSWVYRITYNNCLDELRKRNKMHKHVEINEFTERELISVENVIDKMQKEELSELVKTAIEQLPGEMGFLLTLHYFENYSIKEMANALKIKPNNAKVKLHRARLKLTNILKQSVEREVIKNYGAK
ncbi:MAG: sigma-70 family RNA polymerase sigma factor [Bacteroidetes bacterium]|jgi:RNA polymerase sigma-70 factor (ECF subfamily)|nr:sigma-70 family RNA polymerase sigma factor [Bacteroidota bacterium]